MEKIKELYNILESIHNTLSFSLTPTWSIKLLQKEYSQALFQNLEKAKNIVTELGKIENYNAAYQKKENNSEGKEMVSHPDHYQGGKIECIEAMLDVFGKEKVSAFCELNAFKYIWRSDSKGTDVQDKRKAIWYLDKYNELNKKEQ